MGWEEGKSRTKGGTKGSAKPKKNAADRNRIER